MNPENMDHRVRVTYEMLKQALFRLIKEKPKSEITIKELCYEAKINRTTFYAHFQGVNDLIEHLERELWVDIFVILKRSEKDRNYFGDRIFLDIYELSIQYKELFHLLLIQNADPMFLEKVYNLGRSAFQNLYNRPKGNKNPIQMEYYYISVLNSFIGILRQWMTTGMKESVHEISDITKRIITRGIYFTLEEN